MATVYTLNTDNLHTGNSVEVHSPTCQHVAKYKRHPFFEEGWTDEIDDPQDIFNEYNEDFYAEGGNGACWAITVYPCSGLVIRKTDITKWKEPSNG